MGVARDERTGHFSLQYFLLTPKASTMKYYAYFFVCFRFTLCDFLTETVKLGLRESLAFRGRPPSV